MYSSDLKTLVEMIITITTSSEAMMGLFFGIMIFSVVLGLILLISYWKIFNKAGKPGWASIIPIYNYVVMLKIAKLSMMYLILLIIPIVSIFAIFKINIEIAKKFGKSSGFGVGITLLPIIFVPLLAFSDNNYEDNKIETSAEENSNNNVNTQEKVVQPNNEKEVANIEINNQAPIMTNEQNTISEQPLENNTSNEINKTEEPNIANKPVISTEINSNITTMNEVPVVEPVNIEPIVQNITETPNAFNSKPIDIIPKSNETTNNESIINIEPIEQKTSENTQPIQVGTNNSIEIPEINSKETNEIPTIKEGVFGEQNKVCKNCGEAMPAIVSICPKCGTDNE